MSLVNTLKQEIRAKMLNPIERDEWRYTRYGLLTAVKEMTASPNSIINEDLMTKAKESEGRDLKIPVYKIGDIAITNARSCEINDLENTTEMVPVTWTTLVAGFHMKKSEYHNNLVSYEMDFGKKLAKLDNAFAKAVEQLIFAKLDTIKSGVSNSNILSANYPFTADTMQVASAQQETFFNDLSVIMEEDDFYSMPFKVLSSTGLKPSVTHYGNQGANNDENLTYQFGNFDFRFSNHVVDGAGKKATGFIMNDGDMGIMTHINVDAVMGNETSDGTKWETAFLDVFGFNVAVMHKSTCKDLSGVAGLSHLKATHVEEFEFSIDVALVNTYNSDPATKAGGVKKFEFLP